MALIVLNKKKSPPVAVARVGFAHLATYQWDLKLRGQPKKTLGTGNKIFLPDFVTQTSNLSGAEFDWEIRVALFPNPAQYSIEVTLREDDELLHDPDRFTRDGQTSLPTFVYRQLVVFDVK
jgi:hypothetical protein